MYRNRGYALEDARRSFRGRVPTSAMVGVDESSSGID